MKLTNTSPWLTADLWDFLKEALRQYRYEGELTVEVVKSRRRTGACSSRFGKTMTLRLPDEGGAKVLSEARVLYLARVVWWVLGYLRGWPQSELRRWRKVPVDWAKGKAIHRLELPEPLTKAEKLDKLRATRAKRAKDTVSRLEDRVERLTKALKLAQKRLTKAQRRVRYYEKNETAEELAERIKAKLAAQAEPKA
jgi:hypothetical protein